MKVETKQTKKEFQPIEMTITFESEEELCNLWHRLNIRSYEVMINTTKASYVKFPSYDKEDKLWIEVDNILCNLNS